MDPPVELNYTEAGTGMPVVLLHGFPLDSQIWRHQQQGLSDEFRVIVPDLRGHGHSPATDGRYDMEMMAQDVFHLLTRLKIEHAAVLGHSMGGYVALAGYSACPEKFLGLGLICSHPFADSEEGRAGRLQMAERVLAEGPQVAADAMLKKLFAPGIGDENPLVEQVRRVMLGVSKIGIAATQRGMAARSDSTDLLRELTIPFLMLAGEKDQIVPIARAQETAALSSQSTLSIISGAGHLPMLEHPDATTTAIREFLHKVLSSRKTESI